MLWRVLRGRRVWVLGGLLLVLTGWAVFTWMRLPRKTAVLRGQDLALRMGCYACHGPGGHGGNANPGASEEEVPAWNGGMMMMYVERPE